MDAEGETGVRRGEESAVALDIWFVGVWRAGGAMECGEGGRIDRPEALREGLNDIALGKGGKLSGRGRLQERFIWFEATSHSANPTERDGFQATCPRDASVI